MKLTIITINYNNNKGLLRTIGSVKNQKKKEFEHVLIDGFSDDGSLETLQQYKSDILVGYTLKVISEQDCGIYDAMNKGVLLASNEYIIFLNSGDVFEDNNSTTNIMASLKSLAYPEAIYFNISHVDKHGHVSRIWRTGYFRRWSYIFGWMTPHPGTIMSAKLFEKHGLFKKKYKVAGDYELMLRFFYKLKITPAYIDKYIVKQEHGGVSTNGLTAILQSNLESLKAWYDNGYIPPIWILICKPLSKIFQLKSFKILLRILFKTSVP